MSDELEQFMKNHPATPERPLQGLTVLVVEDSRFASEAIRLLSLRSGARIRRADSLGSAYRHLRVYRPSIVIVDMGLPDGSGAELIKSLASGPQHVPVILGMSGDDTTRNMAIDAGAAGFLSKPVESLAVFQHQILSVMAKDSGSNAHRFSPYVVSDDVIEPDEIALQDDLVHAAQIMRGGVDGPTQDYLAQFLGGLARSTHDSPLEIAATRLANARASGRGAGGDLAHVEGLVQERLTTRQVV